MGKRSITGVLLAAMIASFIAILAPAAGALTSVESCFYNSINRERTARGLARLALYADLTSIARGHSQRMARDGRIYHNTSLGSQVSGSWYAVGENVGMGPDCASLHSAFMASSGHRANILYRSYNQVGVGVATGSDGTIYITEDFAGRRSSTATRPRTTTTTHVTRRVTPTRVAAPKPKPAPKPAPPPQATPVTVSVLVRLIGMDARRVDPATGDAMGL